MSYEPTREILHGFSYEKAKLFGMPHIGCKYRRDDINETAFIDDTRRCAGCGRTNGAHNRHHEPPKSNGSFLLVTPRGKFVLKPALIDLCGSGTTGCHGERHNKKLKITWEWDSGEYEEQWWSGYLLSRPYHEPHGKWLYGFGRYIFERNGQRWEYRDL